MLPYYINKILRKLNIIIIFRKGNAIGEIVYLTSLINCLYSKNTKYKIIILSKYPEIFLHNKKVFLNLKIYKNFFYRLFFLIFFRIQGKNIINFNHATPVNEDTHFLKKNYYYQVNSLF